MYKEIRTFISNEALVDERRKQIVKSASSLFLKKGYDRTTVREVAAAIGMTDGGLYRYIGSKDDIMQLVISFTTARQEQKFRAIRNRTKNLRPTEALQESIRMHLSSADEMQDLYNFLNHVVVCLQPDDRQILFNAERSIIAYFEELLMNGIEAGEFKIEDPKLVAFNIVMAADVWATRRWFLKKHYTLDKYIQQQGQLILKEVCVDGCEHNDGKEMKIVAEEAK